MRCKACNVELNDFESTRTRIGGDEYLDLCNECLNASLDNQHEDTEDYINYAEYAYIPMNED